MVPRNKTREMHNHHKENLAILTKKEKKMKYIFHGQDDSILWRHQLLQFIISYQTIRKVSKPAYSKVKKKKNKNQEILKKCKGG